MNMNEIEELKRQWAYAGKPKQWQDGFNAMGQEYVALKNEMALLIEKLRTMPVSMIEVNPVKMFSDDDREPFIHKPVIDEILSKH